MAWPWACFSMTCLTGASRVSVRESRYRVMAWALAMRPGRRLTCALATSCAGLRGGGGGC